MHSVLCCGELQCDEAKKYQVTDGFVSWLIKQVKKDTEYFEKLLKQSREKEDERAAIALKISDLSD